MNSIERYFEVSRYTNPVWVGAQEIAYLRSTGGVKHLWKQNLTTGEAREITQNKEAVRALMGYPESGSILFTMDAGGDENEQIFRVDADDVITPITNSPQVAYHLCGLRPNVGTVLYTSNSFDKAVFDAYEYNPETKEERLLFRNEEHLKIPCSVSPNGRYMLFNVLLGKYNNALFMIDMEAGSTVRVPARDGLSAEESPTWKPDSTGFYVVTDRDCDKNYAAYYDIASGVLTTFAKKDWDVDHLCLSPDGKYLILTYNEDGYSRVECIDLETNTVEEVKDFPQGVVSKKEEMPWSVEGHRFLFSVTDSATPSSIWMYDADAKKSTCIVSEKPENLPDDLVQPELIHYQSFDGEEIPFWFYRPKGAAEKNLPVLFDIHGGPESQSFPEYIDYRQYLISQGIALVVPNVRGSTGYGKRYSKLDDREKRLDSVKDIGALVDYLKDSGLANPAKMAVLGKSYGGFMCLSSISMFPDAWACAVDFVGIYNFVTFLEHTSAYRRAWREDEYGTLAHDREMLYQVSPASRIQNAKAPLMVIHGGNDPRVPISETEDMTQTLRNKGNHVEFIRYEDEGHSILKLKNKLDCYAKVANFLKTQMNL